MAKYELDWKTMLAVVKSNLRNEGIMDEDKPKIKETLKEHQDKIGELWDADTECWHELDPNCWSGVKCIKCGGWFCY